MTIPMIYGMTNLTVLDSLEKTCCRTVRATLLALDVQTHVTWSCGTGASLLPFPCGEEHLLYGQVLESLNAPGIPCHSRRIDSECLGQGCLNF